jgi:hypothetical protein
VVHFVTAYPGEFREGDIGWLYFWFLYRRINIAMALRRVNDTRSVALGFGGKEATTEAQKDITQAFPNG